MPLETRVDSTILTPVESGAVAAVGYDPKSAVLFVEFHDGDIYQYFAVPQSKYEALMAAESIGRYLNTVIKPRHANSKIEPED